MSDQPQILARIDARRYFDRGLTYRHEVCAWLRANGIDPDITAVMDIEVLLLDAPAIARTEYVLDADGHHQLVGGEVLVRRVLSLLRVPLPAHLDDLRTVSLSPDGPS